MQLPRVVIAAVFLVIGALIAIPALMKSSGSGARASSTTSASASPGSSGSGSSPSPTRTTHKPSHSPTPSKSPKSPTPSTGAPQPVTATIGSVSCPSRSVRVIVRNTGTQREDYTVLKNDDTATVPGTVPAHDSRTLTVKLKEDLRTLVQVDWANKQIETRSLKANCTHAGAAPVRTTPNKLPHTGPDTVLWARAATGVGVMLTGVIIFWYGGVWPRRREQIFKKDA